MAENAMHTILAFHGFLTQLTILGDIMSDLPKPTILDEIMKTDRPGTYTVRIPIFFLNEEEWMEMIEDQLKQPDEVWRGDSYKDYVRRSTRAVSFDRKIFIRDIARDHVDFRRLLLHELGHEVCGLWHTDTKGDIMNAKYWQWYGDASPEEEPGWKENEDRTKQVQ
jgi:hypothetical protein